MQKKVLTIYKIISPSNKITEGVGKIVSKFENRKGSFKKLSALIKGETRGLEKGLPKGYKINAEIIGWREKAYACVYIYQGHMGRGRFKKIKKNKIIPFEKLLEEWEKEIKKISNKRLKLSRNPSARKMVHYYPPVFIKTIEVFSKKLASSSEELIKILSSVSEKERKTAASLLRFASLEVANLKKVEKALFNETSLSVINATAGSLLALYERNKKNILSDKSIKFLLDLPSETCVNKGLALLIQKIDFSKNKRISQNISKKVIELTSGKLIPPNKILLEYLKQFVSKS